MVVLPRAQGRARRPGPRRGPPRTLATASLLLVGLTLASCDGCTERPTAERTEPAPSGDRSTSDGKPSSQCPPGTTALDGSVRPAALAGGWYSDDAESLRSTIRKHLQKATPWSGARPMALVSPHAGYRYSGATAGHGYRTVQGRSYERVFLIGPAHRSSHHGASIPPDAFYETPLGRLPLDRAVAATLLESPLFDSHPAAHRQEHCLEIQLPFLQQTLKGPFAIVPMLIGSVSRDEIRELSALLREVISPKDLLIVSSDFTHYGPRFDYTPFQDDVPSGLGRYADEAYAAIAARDVDALLSHQERTGDSICGIRPIAIALGLLPQDAKAHRLAFDTSGNITGDYTNSVSYLSIAFTGSGWTGKPPAPNAPPGCVPTASTTTLGASSKTTAHTIARRALAQWVRERTRFDPDLAELDLSAELKRPLGVFVTLNKHGKLRGCIGNIVARGPLHQAIAGRAIDASQDRRFSPVTPGELGDIEIEISVLTEPRPVQAHTDIVIGRDGVIFRKGGRSAVYLPQVAPEQGWNVEQTLQHLSQKAGLGADDWRQGARFEVFQALVF